MSSARHPKPHLPPPNSRAKRNVILLGADMALFMMAVGLVSSHTLIPLFVSKLTDSPLAIGALAAAFQLGWLPQVVAAGFYERSPHKRRWLIGFGLLERLPAAALAICALLATTLAAPIVVALVYLARFGQTVAGGPAATAWMDYVGRVVPEGRRGNFMGVSTTLGNLLGAGAVALAAPLFDRLPFPYGFAACFGIGAFILLLGALPLIWVVDPSGPPPRPAQSWRAQLAELPAVFQTDRAFRRFLVGLSLVMLGTMGASFVVVYGVTSLGASDELAAWYTAALLLGQVTANLLFGWLADRRGFAAVAAASGVAGVCMAGATLLAPSATWLILSFVLLGANQAGVMLAKFAGPMDFGPPDRRPTYVALAGAIVSLVAAVAPLIGGQIAAMLGYGWLFAASLALSLAGLPFFSWDRKLRQPRPSDRPRLAIQPLPPEAS